MYKLKGNIVRASRSLLGWSQNDLAERSGVAAITIKTIELNKTQASISISEKIIECFMRNNVFMTATGTELREDNIEILTGESAVFDLFKYIASDLEQDDNLELLISFADESKSPTELMDIVEGLRQEGLKMRHIVKEGDTFLTAPLNEYKYIAERFYDNTVSFIFGNRVAQSTYTDTPQIALITNADLAKSHRNQFNFMWENSETPKISSAERRFS